MMWKDPIVEETRRMKDEYASKFNGDLQAIYHDLKELEKQLPEDRLIRTQPTIRNRKVKIQKVEIGFHEHVPKKTH